MSGPSARCPVEPSKRRQSIELDEPSHILGSVESNWRDPPRPERRSRSPDEVGRAKRLGYQRPSELVPYWRQEGGSGKRFNSDKPDEGVAFGIDGSKRSTPGTKSLLDSEILHWPKISDPSGPGQAGGGSGHGLIAIQDQNQSTSRRTWTKQDVIAEIQSRYPPNFPEIASRREREAKREALNEKIREQWKARSHFPRILLETDEVITTPQAYADPTLGLVRTSPAHPPYLYPSDQEEMGLKQSLSLLSMIGNCAVTRTVPVLLSTPKGFKLLTPWTPDVNQKLFARFMRAMAPKIHNFITCPGQTLPRYTLGFIAEELLCNGAIDLDGLKPSNLNNDIHPLFAPKN